MRYVVRRTTSFIQLDSTASGLKAVEPLHDAAANLRRGHDARKEERRASSRSNSRSIAADASACAVSKPDAWS
jgi:hypothetical protein